MNGVNHAAVRVQFPPLPELEASSTKTRQTESYLNIKDITFAETATTTGCDFLWDLSILLKPFLDES